MNEIQTSIHKDLSQSFNQELQISESFGDTVILFPKEKVIPLMSHLKTRHHFEFITLKGPSALMSFIICMPRLQKQGSD
jgi:hypothetical protein